MQAIDDGAREAQHVLDVGNGNLARLGEHQHDGTDAQALLHFDGNADG